MFEFTINVPLAVAKVEWYPVNGGIRIQLFPVDTATPELSTEGDSGRACASSGPAPEKDELVVTGHSLPGRTTGAIRPTGMVETLVAENVDFLLAGRTHHDCVHVDPSTCLTKENIERLQVALDVRRVSIEEATADFEEHNRTNILLDLIM